ncbi:MAG: FAD:protein FMN transferase [Chloroflexota bacterium]
MMPVTPRIRAPHAFGTISMDTGVNVQIVSDAPRSEIEPMVNRALKWFDAVERICTRFDPASEVMQLLEVVGPPVVVSTLLFEAVAFAVDLAHATAGAFDPTIGAHIEQLGFRTNYRTGQVVDTPVQRIGATYRDIVLDRAARTITLRKPVILDLNAIAKGLAIDLAMQELTVFRDVCLEAGGDLAVRGRNASGDLWQVGIQHPRADGLLSRTLHLTDTAVCTSGDYERRGDGGASHVQNARTHAAISDLASVTVIASTAMAADGLSTAAMVLGHDQALSFLAAHDVAGLVIAPDGTVQSVGL